jgi:hypothetical protein
MTETITCPSGLSGRIRGIKVREERILADRKLAKSGGQLEQILAACWEETLDPSGDVQLSGDRMAGREYRSLVSRVTSTRRLSSRSG